MVTLDIMMILLMLITIGFCYHLNRKIIALQKGKKELAKLITYFDGLVQRVESGTETIKTSSEEVFTQLQEAKLLRDDLNFLRDDLNFLLKRGSHLADNLVSQVNRVKRPAETPPPPSPSYTGPAERASSSIVAQTNTAERAPVEMNYIPSGTATGIDAMKKIAITTLLERISAGQNSGSNNG